MAADTGIETDTDTWGVVGQLAGWLKKDAEASNISPDALLMLRRDKISEENGEISEVLQGAFAANRARARPIPGKTCVNGQFEIPNGGQFGSHTGGHQNSPVDA